MTLFKKIVILSLIMAH